MQQQENRTVTELVRQAAGGDHRAYARLISAHTGLVRSIVYAETLSADDAEDLVQETFVRAYTRLDQLRAPNRFAAWVARIAVTCARDWTRRVNREAALHREWADAELVGAGAVPDTEGIVRHELVAKGLDSLPTLYRRPLVMRYMADSPYAEIATTLLISEDAVRMRVGRALSMLRQFFRRAGLDADCREALRTHCLAIAAVADAAESALREIRARPLTPHGAPRPALAALVAGAVTVTGAVAALLIGAIAPHVRPGADRIPAHDGSDLSRKALEILLHRPVVAIRGPVLTATRRTLLAADDQLDGWAPADPRKDATLPTAAGSGLPDRPGAGVLRNTYGVYRPFVPITGIVRVEVWLKPSPERLEAALGLMFGPRIEDWQPVVVREYDGRWSYRVGYGESYLPSVTRDALDVGIAYHTDDATYDLTIDGTTVAEGVALPSALATRPVQGIYLRSGDARQGARTYFDDLRVTHAPTTAGSGRRARVGIGRVPAYRRGSPRVHVRAGSINGTALRGDQLAVSVQPGQPIQGMVTIDVENPHADNGILPVVAVPTWGNSPDAYRTITRDAPSGRSEFTASLDLTAPAWSGVYHIIIAAAAEKEPSQVASGTNWDAGAAAWGNEMDIAAWTPDLIDAAMRYGSVYTPWMDGRRQRWRQDIGAAALRIRVAEALP